MEFTLDFSKAIAKKRQGPKSSAQTPAKPDERKKGSSRNEPGSAGTSPDAKEKAEKNLKNMLHWDVNNGIARRSWARNKGAIQAIKTAMKKEKLLKITLPNIVDEKIIKDFE